MRHFFSLAFLLVSALSFSVLGQVKVKGVVMLPNGEPAGYATVAATQLSLGKLRGANTDGTGSFSLALEIGRHELVVHLIGYHDLDTVIDVKNSMPLPLRFFLAENAAELGAVQVYADRKDIAREVVSKAIDARSKFLDAEEAIWNYEQFVRTSIQMLTPDTTTLKTDSVSKEVKVKNRPLVFMQYHLHEAVANAHWSAPLKFHERVMGVKEYSKRKPASTSSGASVSFSYGESDITPQEGQYDDNYILRSYTGFMEFNMYQRLLPVTSITDKPLMSPIGEGALLSYRYDLDGVNDSAGVKYYTVAFSGIFPGEPLLKGTMVIRSSDWALIRMDASLDSHVMKFFNDFTLHQTYSIAPNGQAIVEHQLVRYSIKENRTIYYGKIECDNAKWTLADDSFRFTDEARAYHERAFDRDSLFWAPVCNVPLDSLEQRYGFVCDSLQKRFASDDYYHEADSTYNALRWIDFFLYGMGYRNRERDYSFYINPLTMQVNPFGIGGYRHRVGGSFKKEFDNAYTLEVEGEADYGFRNNDLRGRGGVGLTYVPLKFVRTFVRFGDYYDMVNNYASLGSIFSRSNYVRTQTWSVAQRMEIVNGLFAELTFDFSDQQPIVNLLSDRWSQQVFGDVNTPLDFERYIKSEFKLEMKYRHKQRYMIKKGRKILLGSVYPDLKVVYRKGVPGLLNSEVDFDYIEVGLKHKKTFGRLGDMDWSVLAGSFVNKRNLRLLEHRYFRGSDFFFFSDPLNSFQLLGPTLSTSNAFFRANYFHHFNGILLNKIPLLHRLKITEAAGAAMLSIPDENFHHLEFYAGLERVVRIKKELFRFGIYASTADSNWEKAKFDFKIGVNFYNAFTKKWQY